MSFSRFLSFASPLLTLLVVDAIAVSGSLAVGCGTTASSNDAGSHSSASSSAVSSAGSESSSTSKTGTPCGDAGVCGANEVCVSFDENLSGGPEQLDDAGQPIPHQGPEFLFRGTGCVPVKAGCSPLSCDCITCPDAGGTFYQCVFPADPGSPSEAVASCSEPTA